MDFVGNIAAICSNILEFAAVSIHSDLAVGTFFWQTFSYDINTTCTQTDISRNINTLNETIYNLDANYL